MLLIELRQLSGEIGVRTAVCPELADDLIRRRLELLAGGKRGFKPEEQHANVGVGRIDGQRPQLLKLALDVRVEAPLGTVSQHSNVAPTGPLAASFEKTGQLCCRSRHLPRAKVLSDFDDGRSDCKVDPAPILGLRLQLGTEVVRVKPEATDQKQLSDICLDHRL